MISLLPYPQKIFLKFIANKATPKEKIIIEKIKLSGIKKFAKFPNREIIVSPKIPKTANLMFLKLLNSFSFGELQKKLNILP